MPASRCRTMRASRCTGRSGSSRSAYSKRSGVSSTDGMMSRGGSVAFRSKRLFVHCCHCRWCQRETGSSFALNAMLESDRVVLLQGELEVIDTPSNSGKGQRIARCSTCRIAVWSNCAGGGDAVRFVRVGTLDEPDRLPPDIHIFTSSKQPWVVLAPHVPDVPDYYNRNDHWPRDSLDRRAALVAAGLIRP